MATPDSIIPTTPQTPPPPREDVPTRETNVPDGPDVEEVPPEVLPGHDVDPAQPLPAP